MFQINTELIKSLRKNKKLSQKQLGNLLGISDRAISRWEIGETKPTAKNLVILSKIFGVSINDFFCEDFKNDDQGRLITGMSSLTELYKIGRGPSSSHTIGPERACKLFKSKNENAHKFKAILYGSLAKTGKGHGTDLVIKKTFAPIPCQIEFNVVKTDMPHPNTLELFAYNQKDEEIDQVQVLSIGGGSILFDNEKIESSTVYSQTKFSEISNYCKENDLRLYQYVIEREGKDIAEYMQGIWTTMKASIKNGLKDEGILPGGLNVKKKAKTLYQNEHIDETAETKENRVVCAYAFAVAEQNASGETIVTAPTCGSAGVLPAVLMHQQKKYNYSDEQISEALMTAGLVGNLIKTNASISGAECGCQAEIGSACAMAAAALAELKNLSLDKIEYAAEIAIEHHLGLTCDPICGLVQIPCIERNAVAAIRAINAVNLSNFLWDSRKISFDDVVVAMKETGRDILSSYRETSEAGLAKIKI
ncbi:MAG: L-serine ammonia-lyase, iron-sulfur-dependent, subunit alpha [Clostridia bacterium]|nr:L-serine ammonia-lyase, iron-sulfur-dependent, subunit alpha [Clostridia bacterium]